MTNRPDFIHEFLYGDAKIISADRQVQTSLVMQPPMEGWIGIPHGGIGMGILLDLAMFYTRHRQGSDNLYPFVADFRLAGATVKIGDTLDFNLSTSEGGAEGEVLADHNSLPYLSASIRYGDDTSPQQDPPSLGLPERIDHAPEGLASLPHYKHCFVCGVERKHPGLRRHFRILDESGKIIITTAGYDALDRGTFFCFQRDGLLHPLPMVALLDEILGWSGFFLTASGAVTVKIDFTFYRPVAATEKLIFLGRADRRRGKPQGRLLYWASGGAAVVHEDGSLEVVARASGQYYALQSLTEQMKTSLQPKDLTEHIFALAERNIIDPS